MDLCYIARVHNTVCQPAFEGSGLQWRQVKCYEIESTVETVCYNWMEVIYDSDCGTKWGFDFLSLESQQKIELLIIIGRVRVTEIKRNLLSEVK